MDNNTFALPKHTYLSGRYMIDTVLGMGGFGITYAAKDCAKNIRCAIKEYAPRDISIRLENHMTLSPTSNSKKEIYDHGMRRFIEEAKVLEKLNYVEAVVSVYDSFYENGTCYFVMEYVDGYTLSKVIKSQNGHLNYNIVKEVFYDLGLALMQVHSLNIFHRDISPDNIMINTAGQVKLIDFGNAKNIVCKDDKTLSVILKPGFAPPEQYSSKSIQGAFTDVYAMASSMYYSLTGKKVPDAIERYKSNSNLYLDKLEIPSYAVLAMDMALKLNYKERTQTVEEFLENLHWLKDKEKDQETHPNSHEMKLQPYLYILSGDYAGETINMPLNKGVIIGRSSELSQIVFFQDKYISKRHCEVYYDSLNETFYIADFSTNGTWVNEFRLNKNKLYKVEVGSTVVLANRICSFKVGVKLI